MSILLILMVYSGMAQSFTEKITKEFSFEKSAPENAIMVANINGGVKVMSYMGTKILVEVTKTIRAKSEARLERGKQAIQLGVSDLADTIILYTKGTCSTFDKAGRRMKGDNGWMRNWNYSWSNCDNDCREEFEYTMDYVIKVPATLHVSVSTVNDGDLVVENVTGSVYASNVNGSIKLTNIQREAFASTINGDVDVVYTRNPDKPCRFYSLNGDINALFPKGLSANMSFESFNGSFYTNVDHLESLPVQVEKTNLDEGIQYKVNGNRYQIGKGGPLLDFETFNGNVYLKEN